MCRLALLAALLVVVPGCAPGGGSGSSTAGVRLTEIVRVLPTPAGFDQSNDTRAADVAAVQEALAGVARAESAKALESRGFKEGTIRRWSGPDGARFTVVVSRWPDHRVATAIGGGAVILPLDQDVPGATAWNPEEIPSGRGARIGRPGQPARLLALAVADVSLFVRADGPVGDGPVLRTMELLWRQLAAPQA